MTESKLITLVTERDMPGVDSETPFLAQALRSLGVVPEIVTWRDAHDWRRSSVVVLRTPWDYASHVTQYRAWIRLVDGESRLRNPADVVLWNLHKGYL